MKKNYGPFFSNYRVSQTSLDYLEIWTSYFDNYCGSYKIIFLGPIRLLKTQFFEKKFNPSDEEKFWPTFPRNIECEKHHGAIDICLKGILAKTVCYNIISVLPNWLLKTQKFDKKGNLSNEEKLWPFLLVLSTVTNLLGLFRRLDKLFWQLLWKL